MVFIQVEAEAEYKDRSTGKRPVQEDPQLEAGGSGEGKEHGGEEDDGTFSIIQEEKEEGIEEEDAETEHRGGFHRKEDLGLFHNLISFSPSQRRNYPTSWEFLREKKHLQVKQKGSVYSWKLRALLEMQAFDSNMLLHSAGVHGNQTRFNELQSLQSLKNPTLLDLRNSRFSDGLTSKEIQEMSSLAELGTCRLGSNRVEKPEEFGGFQTFSNTGLEGEIPWSILELKKLRFLGLSKQQSQRQTIFSNESRNALCQWK
ncbi:hypothetical protein YC2023_052603 [Brassica napus]